MSEERKIALNRLQLITKRLNLLSSSRFSNVISSAMQEEGATQDEVGAVIGAMSGTPEEVLSLQQELRDVTKLLAELNRQGK